jgi:hypothetical protein
MKAAEGNWARAAVWIAASPLGAVPLAAGAAAVAAAYWAVLGLALAFTWVMVPEQRQGRHRKGRAS